MRTRTIIGATAAAAVLGAVIVRSALQGPTVIHLDESELRQYAGVYQWSPDAFVYLQMWNELTGANQLVAFDESGELRTLYPTERDRFFAGPGAASADRVESRIHFQRDAKGAIASLTWQRDGAAARTARRVDIEKVEDVRFVNGDVQLAGSLIAPAAGNRHPAIVLVHGSGPANREWTLPFARFLVRRGMAVLGYDKRGVGGSTGDWNQASLADLAGDAEAAFRYLKGRKDVDGQQIGLMGVSQAGWVMPIAAVRARDIAFVISVSGAGLTPAETTFDQAQGDMAAAGMKPPAIAQIVEVMKAQYEFARTGKSWDQYAALRARLAERIGTPPPSFPATPDDQYWQFIRRTFFHDPAPTLRALQAPTLAIFGELDHNIVADKNSAAWDAALKAGGNRDYTLRTLPNATHLQLEGARGSRNELKSMRRFVPDYFMTVETWLAKRVKEFSTR